MGYIETWKKVVFKPSSFFREMPEKGGFADPIMFTIMNALIAGVLAATVGRVFDPRMNVIWEAGNVSFLFFMSFLVIGIVLLNFVFGAILHVLFRLVGGKGSYQGTFRLVAYAGAPGIFEAVPLLHSSLYTPYLQIVGGRHVHNISMKRSAVAVLLPIAAMTIGLFLLIWPEIS